MICKGVEKAVPTTADCGVPPPIWMTPGGPASTVSGPEVPEIEVLTSVAVTVWLPAVPSVTWKVPTPLVNVEFGGSEARVSELAICTVPVYPVAVFPYWSRAVTVTLNCVPALTDESPIAKEKWVAGPGVLVSEKVISRAPPLTLAVTE